MFFLHMLEMDKCFPQPGESLDSCSLLNLKANSFTHRNVFVLDAEKHFQTFSIVV